MPPPKPFPQDVQWSLQPAGAFISSDRGALQARVYKDVGHIELVGPDLAGVAGANIIRFAPPAVNTAKGTFSVGRLISSKQLANGLEITQALGASQITARLTFPQESVMRYEVVDWGAVGASASAIAVPSDAQEHFYGFGEKFNTVDQAGKQARILTFDDPGTKGDHSYKVAPWFVSTRGYGFHLDSSAESTLDMRAGAPNRYVVANLFPTLRFNIVYGPKLTDVLSRYTSYTGRPALPPPWAFGPWISSDIWRSWRRGPLCRHPISKSRYSSIGLRVRFTLGDGLQRFPVQHDSVRQGCHDRWCPLPGVHIPGRANEFSAGQGPESNLLDGAIHQLCAPLTKMCRGRIWGKHPTMMMGPAGECSLPRPRTARRWLCPGGRARAVRWISPTLRPGNG